MAFKLALLLAVVAFASVSATTTTTVTTSVTTVSADDDSEGGLLLSAHDRSVIRKTWDQARRDGDVPHPQILFRFIKAHSKYQKMFSKFASVPQNEYQRIEITKFGKPSAHHRGEMHVRRNQVDIT
ncbi:hypothetical protein DAPPUDRAFT_325182 [Daphnia pulex]|uniref:Globin domain-containing protein n=1 Tax=Daphnia pulex TaxID=6669 RepID=E9H3Y8_DAPPU|nr:hypothetical protein DAPPUDRAFT_325182 [Daphnia pulex]|eukprot:EFX73609.1 hypothetical protein DAPPUDRAFT_325182 [Daphnia pulex]